jgi:predicted transglutaminase-like cysteine proteinase
VPVLTRIVAVLLFASLSACASDDVGALPAVAAHFQGSVSPAANFNSVRGGPAKAPSGYAGFCARFPDQCTTPEGASHQVNLTDEVWQVLEEVNATINRSILAADDRDHYASQEYWTIPTDGFGDCEDYVVAKRQALIRLGLPEPALRITIVFAPHFARHAVLTVATDKGDYVLDNLRADIVTPEKTGYAFVERQDPASASGWVSLE